MCSRRNTPIWVEMLGETLWGPRSLIKLSHLWLPLAFLLSSRPSDRTGPAWASFFLVCFVLVCWIQASILANDLADRRDDRAADKSRWITRLRPGCGAAVVAVLAGTGMALGCLADKPVEASVAYAIAMALTLLYSIPPVRFKARGWLGLLTYSAACGIAFVALPCAWLGSQPVAVAALAPAVVLDKWVNLHFHQIVDYQSDLKHGVMTYVVASGIARARRTLKWAAGLASLSLLGALLFVVLSLRTGLGAFSAAALVVLLAVAIYCTVRLRRLSRASVLLQELPGSYLGLTYVVLRLLPLYLMARLTLREPSMGLAFGLAAMLISWESWRAFRYRYR